ncbi:3291_t:CDS:2, partial [Ambispora gerdemannii]
MYQRHSKYHPLLPPLLLLPSFPQASINRKQTQMVVGIGDFHPYPYPISINRKQTQMVVGIDFGITESGFAFCPRPLNNEQINVNTIEINSTWAGHYGNFKTNTALQYDSNWNVTNWVIQHFGKQKFHLFDIPEDEKPLLPPGLNYQKAIADYFRELGKSIKAKLEQNWPQLDFYNDVEIVMTVPVDFSGNAKTIMRISKAAAIYCLHYVNNYQLRDHEPYMIVDCGGGIVDLTTRTLLPGKQISEVTMRTG